MAIKLTKRKGFNFYRSYYDVYNELETNEDKVAFIDALLDRQFLGIKPNNLTGMAKFAYISQTNAIDSQVKGYEDKTKTILTPTQGGTVGGKQPPCLQEKEKEKVKHKDFLLSEIKISDVDDDLKQFYKIALNFQKLFIKNLKEKNAPTKHQENAKFKKYVDPIRLMIKNNECTIDNLREVYAYLNSPRGEFWKTNILSTETLRKHISKLVMSAKMPEFKPKKEDRL